MLQDIFHPNGLFLLPVAALVCASAATVIYRRWFDPLSAFPGPFLASITRLWYTWVMWRGHQDVVLPALHEQYGPHVRVAPNEIHTTDPQYLRPVYGVGSKFSKTDFFKVFQGTRKFDLVSERDHHKHAAQRRLVAQAYSMSAVRPAEGSIDITLGMLLKRFDVRVGKPFDISQWMQFWSFDTIGMVTFSQPFGFIEAEKDWNHALTQIRQAMDSAAWIGQLPQLYAFCLTYIFPITGNFFALANRHGSVRKYAIEQATERQKRGAADRPDIMQTLLNVHNSKAEFDTVALQSMVTTNIFGGAETTTSSLRAVIYYLLKNPQYKAKLVAEIDQHCQDANIERGAVVPYSLVEKMPYLHAAIYEGMRLFPANGIPSGRVVPASMLDFAIDGKIIPPGTEITIFSWCLHRRTDLFGPDAWDFNPDRWLAADAAGTTETGDMDAASSSAQQRNFFSFGGGARVCLGRNLAMMEMTKCLATLLRRYDVELAHPEKEWTVEGSFIKGQSGIEVVLTKREGVRG